MEYRKLFLRSLVSLETKLCLTSQKRLIHFAFLFFAIALFVFGNSVSAQEENITAALADLSKLYGSPVERVDQAKAICNLEKYLADCAEIGKKHDLFDPEEEKQVDSLLVEFKDSVIDDLKNCQDTACLIEVAGTIATSLSNRAPSLARDVDLSPQKVEGKRTILEAAKEVGVNFEECKTMDPDTASIDLLRSCAKLAKHQNIQQYIPEESKRASDMADGSLLLQESLARGEYQCGDGTLEGCGNFCLNPGAGNIEIPGVCKQIAERFFGSQGVAELENAYSGVQQTARAYERRVENVIFSTADGRVLTDPGAIGRYLEEEGRRGNVAAVEKGMDFLVSRGFVKQEDKEFALGMVRKIQERGAPIDFDRCRTNPEECQEFIPDANRQEFQAMREVEGIMREEMESRGVSDPRLCENNPELGPACVEAGKAALPRIEAIAEKSPQVRFIVEDIKRHISFADQGLEARRQIEEKFREGDQLFIGDQRFQDFRGVDEFCRQNGSLCLTETAKQGLISKDYAAEKYDRYYETQSRPFQEFQAPGQRGTPPGLTPGFQNQGVGYPAQINKTSSFPIGNKEEALKKFQEWLDNPQGPPPIPNAPYAPGQPFQGQQPFYQPQPYPYSPNACVQTFPRPCPQDQYRQESRDQNGCPVYSECIPIATPTQPPSTDNRVICPALPTVDSCLADQTKVVSFSSPECGTYYSCAQQSAPQPSSAVNFPYTLPNGKVVNSFEEAKAYCFANGPGTGQGVAGECETKFGIVYTSNQQQSNQTDCGKYGSGWHSMDSSGNCFSPSMTGYYTVNGTLNSCETTPAYGCTSSQTTSQSANQRQQTWNNRGLTSWIRSDADSAKIESLKQACSNVRSGSNVWEPGSGDYASPNFGMPNADKCQRASQCTAEQYFDGASCTGSPSQQQTTSTTGSQRQQTWNNFGLSSQIRSDADPARIESLKQACANVRSSSSIWESGAGDSSSVDFGMPNANKCAIASQCTSTQYFDGASCVNTTSTTTPTVSGSCSSELIGLLGDGCHNMGSAWFNGAMSSYVVPGSSTVVQCSATHISGCSGGNQTACPSGQYWNGTTCVNTTPTDCPSGQYWNGTSCVSNTTSTSTCSGTQYWNGTACVDSSPSTSCPSDQYWNGTSCVSNTPSTSSTCSGTQYWNGTACVDSPSSTSCSTGQYWNGSSCVASPPSCSSSQYWNGTACVDSSPSTSCPSDQYWNGTSCVPNPVVSPTTTSCPSGQYWNGTACVNTSPTDCPSGQYWNGTSCVSSTTSAPTSFFCPSGHIWNGRSCQVAGFAAQSWQTAGVFGVFELVPRFIQNLLGL